MPAYHKRGQDTAASPRQFSGFPRSNTTQVPDVFFDEIMPFLNLAETRVLLYIIRRTIGFKKDWDGISLNQMANGIIKTSGERLDHGTGLHPNSIRAATKALVEKGILVVSEQFDRDGGQKENRYCLRWEDSTPSQSLLPPHSQSLVPPPTQQVDPTIYRSTRDSRTRDSSKREVSVNGNAAAAATPQRTQQTPLLSSSISEEDYPATSRWVRDRWPTIDELLLRQIYVNACSIAGDRLDDQDMLDAFKTGTRANQKSPALYLKTVPSVVKSWL